MHGLWPVPCLATYSHHAPKMCPGFPVQASCHTVRNGGVNHSRQRVSLEHCWLFLLVCCSVSSRINFRVGEEASWSEVSIGDLAHTCASCFSCSSVVLINLSAQPLFPSPAPKETRLTLAAQLSSLRVAHFTSS